MECKRSTVVETILSKNCMVVAVKLLKFKTYYKAVIIQCGTAIKIDT